MNSKFDRFLLSQTTYEGNVLTLTVFIFTVDYVFENETD